MNELFELFKQILKLKEERDMEARLIEYDAGYFLAKKDCEIAKLENELEQKFNSLVDERIKQHIKP